MAERGARAGGVNGHYLPNGGESVEWYTPPRVFDALGLRFDLDPCSPAGGLPWVPAERHYSAADDGLSQPWAGRVWLNPPYGDAVPAWLRRLGGHGDGIALVFARTDTAWFHEVIRQASALCLIAGRLHFMRPDGTQATHNAGGPSCLLAYGDVCAAAVAASGLGLTFRLDSDLHGWQGALW